MFSEKEKTAVFCKQLEFVYPDGTSALNGISLNISRDEKVAIIGPNGAGKSTFLYVLNGIKNGSGKIEILGLKAEQKNLRKIKSLFGLVFQNPDDQLFCPTIFDDVAFAPLNSGLKKHQIEERVKDALQNVGLKNYEQRSSLHLSYGEKKLVAMASILSMQPKIIALDEPTSNLDPFHRRKIIKWIQNSTLTCIITSHDLDMILETCQRVYIFNRGKIVAEGNTQEILKDKKLLEENALELPLKWQN